MEEETSRPIYVLVVKEENLEALRLYLNNLRSLGLQFENVPGTTVDAVFIKVSISELYLHHFSELYNIGVDNEEHYNRSDLSYLFEPIFFTLFTTPVSQLPPRQKGQVFSYETIMIVNKMLETTKFSHKDKDIGMSKLLRRGILMDAYPLHDGQVTENGYNDRSLLLRFWSNMSCAYREQPLDLVQRYFGSEIAFYFAWLGYFNITLVVPSILGAIVFIISLIRVTFFRIEEVEDICKDSGMYMCPTCEHRSHCTFHKISDFCSMSQWTYVFDNYFTVAFAIFMSFWATFFLTLWQRKENKLNLRWNGNLEAEYMDVKIREVYKEKSKHRRFNRHTGKIEPYVPKVTNFFHYAVSFSVCAVIIAIMIFLVSLNIATGIEFRSFVDIYGNTYVKANKVMLAIMLGSFIQVVIIKLMSLVFGPLSIKLTNLENPPTQHAFDNSVLHKRYLFAFVNNLSPLFYLAFVKGKLYSIPHKNTLYLAQDVCQPQSCIVPLCIQLTFLLTLRSFAGNVISLFIPKIKWMFNKIFGRTAKTIVEIPQWEKEYFMQPSGRYLLTSEFSEMIIKYCLVTFFVGAFPLAPLCALINNVVEVRSDAYKLVTIYRRPIPLPKSGIGSWNAILQIMAYVSMVTNAFVITFTSDFVPDQMFHIHASDDVETYYDYILSKYATKDYEPFTKLNNSVEYCYYRGNFNPPDSPEPYKRGELYWLNFATKFIGIMCFEHVVFLSNITLSYIIPKLPASAQKQLVLKKLEETDKRLHAMPVKGEEETIHQLLKM